MLVREHNTRGWALMLASVSRPWTGLTAVAWEGAARKWGPGSGLI